MSMEPLQVSVVMWSSVSWIPTWLTWSLQLFEINNISLCMQWKHSIISKI